MQYAESHGGKDMPASEVKGSLQWHMNSDSMLAIFPLQDYLAMDESLRLKDFAAERINEPANPAHHWRYRVHFNLEKLMEAEGLNAVVSEMVVSSGRK